MTCSIYLGPEYYPVTGQSHAFKVLSDHMSKENFFLCYPVYNGKRGKFILKLIVFFFSYCRNIFFNQKKINSVYLSCSRSRFSFFRDAFLVLIATLYKKKIVCHVHGADFPDFRLSMGSFKFLVDYIYDCFDVIIVLSVGMIDHFNNYDAVKVVIPNFSNFFPKEPIKRQGPIVNSELRILYLSNIMFSKGVFYLIDAVERAVQLGYNFSLTVAGNFLPDCYMTKKILEKKFFERIEGKDYFKFVGFIDDGKAELLTNHDVLVLPSFYPTEAQPIAIIEGMSFGMPIIATRFNFLDELVTESSGELVEIKDAVQIEGALRNLLDRSRFSECSHFNSSKAFSEFTVDVHVKKIQNVMV